jgi:hypothetical protein
MRCDNVLLDQDELLMGPSEQTAGNNVSPYEVLQWSLQDEGELYLKCRQCSYCSTSRCDVTRRVRKENNR